MEIDFSVQKRKENNVMVYDIEHNIAPSCANNNNLYLFLRIKATKMLNQLFILSLMQTGFSFTSSKCS